MSIQPNERLGARDLSDGRGSMVVQPENDLLVGTHRRIALLEPSHYITAEECASFARLFAAAPGLLAALEPVAKEIKDKCADLQHPSWDTDHHREITLTIGECRAILAALKKAGGAP